jgi:glycerophosphoryl diester phosphodiesterase
VTPAHAFPVVSRLRELARTRPVVTAHRGDSRNFPENTLPAFASAVAMGAKMQEFDVQQTSCGALVCLHDLTLDRTTDAAKALGPGARIADLPLSRAQQLDAGAWKGSEHAGARIPTLEQALAVMLPHSIPMIEHKGGDAQAYVDFLRRIGAADHVLVQSFDWDFVARVRSLASDIALGLLGPTDAHAQLDDSAIAAALRIGASFVHWHATELTRDAIDRAHAAGVLVVTYTSDDELSWHGGRALGVDAMCTNDPRRMLHSLA